MPATVLEHARRYAAAGLSVIPVKGDGSKEPALPPGDPVLNRKRRATDEEIGQWFANGFKGVGVLGGPVSGDLEVIDFDVSEVFAPWRELVEAEAPGLLARLTVNKTPGGWHVCYRCPGAVEGNRLLAREPDPADPSKWRKMIETRGSGGYVLAPGCPAACHQSGRPYEHKEGPRLDQVGAITAEERSVLFDAARSLSTWAPPPAPRPAVTSAGGGAGERPGDLFNERGTWEEAVGTSGWAYVRPVGSLFGWRRPDKDRGISATAGLRSNCGKDLFYVFTSSAPPLEPEKSYDKFGLFAALQHGGDFAAAARALIGMGYGTPSEPAGKITLPAAACEPWPRPVPLNVLPDAPAFPLAVFPYNLRRYCEEVAWAVNAPADFAAVPMLAAAGAALGNSRWLSVTRSHHQPPTIFAAIVGRPGSGKSTPLDFVVAPLHAAEARHYAAWKQDRDQKEEEGKKAKGKALKRCLVDDTTVEAMCRVLHENPRGCLMARDELSALVTGMNQYREGGKGSDRQVFLKVWSASTIKVDRSKLDGVPLTVRRPLVCIVGGIQPEVIDWMKGEQRDGRSPPDDGFLDRFVFSYPAECAAVGEQWRELSPAAADAWAQTIDRLLMLSMSRNLETDELRPEFVPLAADAKHDWAELTQRHADEVNADHFPDWLRGAWSKLVPGYAGRLAIILHCLHAQCGQRSWDAVSGESVRSAFELVAYFKAHVRRVRSALEADPRVREADRVLSWLARRPTLAEFSRRDAYEDLRRSFKAPDALDRPLALLVQHAYLRPVAEEERRGPGRRPTAKFEVNPLWERHEIHEIQAIAEAG
jgi:hypothetical protein